MAVDNYTVGWEDFCHVMQGFRRYRLSCTLYFCYGAAVNNHHVFGEITLFYEGMLIPRKVPEYWIYIVYGRSHMLNRLT